MMPIPPRYNWWQPWHFWHPWHPPRYAKSAKGVKAATGQDGYRLALLTDVRGFIIFEIPVPRSLAILDDIVGTDTKVILRSF